MAEIRIPEVGESVQEALLAQWLKRDGESVRKDEVVLVIETEKVTLEISAPVDGILKVMVPEGQTVKVGTVVGRIEESAGKAVEGPVKPSTMADARTGERIEAEGEGRGETETREKVGAETREPKDITPPEAPPKTRPSPRESGPAQVLGPQVSVRALAEEKGVDLSAVRPTGPGGRITQGDVLLHVEQHGPSAPRPVERETRSRGETSLSGEPAEPQPSVFRKPMSPIRQRIASRLLEAVQTTAMLTTFNEIDMSRVHALRKGFGEQFRQKHGIRLGLMSFFVKAAVEALKEMPEVNAFIEGSEIVYHNYYHIGVAIGAERGLIVPVIRNAEMLGFAGIERKIADFSKKIEENRIELSDLEGGTFTITNGGVFGSLLGTPILNPPQSAILGMHKIEDRPVVKDQQIVIRPMMYVALTYDHRIIDGRGAVTFLRKIKDYVEDPERIMMEI